MDNRNAINKNLQIKSFFYANRENIILILLIFFTVLSIIYKLYEINYNKLAVLNINDKIQIEENKNFNDSLNNIQENNFSDNSAQTIGAPLFVLGEKDGKMTLYSGDSAETVQVYDVYIDTLPEYDKKALEAGIMIYDLKELDSLIEDFTS